MELPDLKWFQILGDISIKPVPTGHIARTAHYLYLLMGPTGAGKSSFIEVLAGESQKISISKNQLEGYTQSVNAYRIVNVTRNERPLYLVDTPGFSDSKISEVEIINMVKKWLKDNGLTNVNRVLYLIPISDTRLPGSRLRTIEMLEQLLDPLSRDISVTFVTTMWDTVHNEHTRMRAESNFAQLRDGICKEFTGDGRLPICRFVNTKNSTLEILDGNFITIDSFSQPMSSALPNLYQDLHYRIEGTLQAKQMIESELAQPEARTNAELRDILEKNQRENYEKLTKFIGQLDNFKPIPKGFEEAHQHLQAMIDAAMQCAPPPTFLQPPGLPPSESVAAIATLGSSAQHATILGGVDTIPTTTSTLLEEESFDNITTTPENPHAALDTDDTPPSASCEPAPQPLPTSPAQLDPSRMLILKGLLRRLIREAKHRGKKWFKNNDA